MSLAVLVWCLLAIPYSMQQESRGTIEDTKFSHNLMMCSFGNASNEDWCGYTQSHSIEELTWKSMSESGSSNRYMGVEFSRDNYSTSGGIARLLSPAQQPPSDSLFGCLTFRYQHTGPWLALLHVVVNVYSTQHRNYSHWFRRKPLPNSGWRTQQLSVQLPTEYEKAYVQISIDVTAGSTPAGEGNLSRVAVDDVNLDMHANCVSTRKKAEDGHLGSETTPKYRRATGDATGDATREDGSTKDGTTPTSVMVPGTTAPSMTTTSTATTSASTTTSRTTNTSPTATTFRANTQSSTTSRRQRGKAVIRVITANPNTELEIISIV